MTMVIDDPKCLLLYDFCNPNKLGRNILVISFNVASKNRNFLDVHENISAAKMPTSVRIAFDRKL